MTHVGSTQRSHLAVVEGVAVAVVVVEEVEAGLVLLVLVLALVYCTALLCFFILTQHH